MPSSWPPLVSAEVRSLNWLLHLNTPNSPLHREHHHALPLITRAQPNYHCQPQRTALPTAATSLAPPMNLPLLDSLQTSMEKQSPPLCCILAAARPLIQAYESASHGCLCASPHEYPPSSPASRAEAPGTPHLHVTSQ
jgi:hypothetical protein